MKRICTANTVLAALLGFAQNATAGTDVQILNALQEDITVNGVVVAPHGTKFSGLPATVQLPFNVQYELKDNHDKEGCGNMWRIEALGPKPTHECMNIEFGQLGCIQATAIIEKGDDLPSIRLTQVAAGVCTDAFARD